MSDITNKTCTE